MDTDKIKELARIYDTMEKQYKKFSQLFTDVPVEKNELCEIPAEVARVVKGVLGVQAEDWVRGEIPALDFQCVSDLVKTEDGLKAVKLILLRMP